VVRAKSLDVPLSIGIHRASLALKLAMIFRR
jgi:hypothetical protein